MGNLRLIKAYNCRISSQIENVSITVKNILKYIQDSKGELEEDVLFDLKVILNELILNAIKHGNKENETKFVNIRVHVTSDKKALIIVSDDGNGYDYRQVYDSSKNKDMCDITRVMETGRGIIIVKSLCDTVKFNKRGNSVCIVKSLISNKA